MNEVQHPMRQYLSPACFIKYMRAIRNLAKKMDDLHYERQENYPPVHCFYKK